MQAVIANGFLIEGGTIVKTRITRSNGLPINLGSKCFMSPMQARRTSACPPMMIKSHILAATSKPRAREKRLKIQETMYKCGCAPIVRK